MPKSILLIEDDAQLRSAIHSFLDRLNYRVESFGNVESALKSVEANGCDLILSDVKMPGLTGHDLLEHASRKFPQIPIILMTAYATIEKAVDAMKAGAYDFLVKPFSLNVLEIAVQSAFLDQDSLESKEEGEPISKVSDQFKTKDPKMLEIIESLKKVAATKATVLIQGESGTGKELLARMVHNFSPRAKRIFVAINCAAMPDTLLESELFGHERGAFTGAVSKQIGRFEISSNGTILLDEISEMSLSMQSKLLRVLQESEIYRVGGVQPLPLNLRIIATTNRNLYDYMKAGNFREDLFYRLNVVPIYVPSLRDRREDILYLSTSCLEEFGILHGRKPPKLSGAAKDKLLNYDWPGNVRELRNSMERVVLVGNFDVIGESSASLIKDIGSQINFADTGMKLKDIEKEVILSTLDRCGGNKTKAALKLGISLRTLRNKLKGYSDVPDEERVEDSEVKC